MSIDALTKALAGAIGENADNQAVKDFIDTGYAPLNEIICGSANGGLPQSRLIEMYGPSSSGKTALATAWMIEAQRQGGVAGFMDHERSFNVELARSMGLKTDFPFWIYKKPRTWEESNTLIAKAAQTIRDAKVIPQNAPILFVFDSIAAALPKSQAEKDIGEYTMNDTTALARVTSTTLKAIAQHAEDYNFTALYLNQIRTKPGVVYGDPTTTPGGGAMEFYATTRLALSRQKVMEEKDGEKEFAGQVITIKTMKNKLTRPFQETKIRLSFNEAGFAYFDTTASLVEHLIGNGKLVYNKPRVTWIDGKQYFTKALVKHIKDNGLEDELKKLALSA